MKRLMIGTIVLTLAASTFAPALYASERHRGGGNPSHSYDRGQDRGGAYWGKPRHGHHPRYGVGHRWQHGHPDHWRHRHGHHPHRHYYPYPNYGHVHYGHGSAVLPIVAGGIVGGVIGNEMGYGDPGSVILGSVVGAVIGHEVAR